MSQLLRQMFMVVSVLVVALAPSLIQLEWADDLGLETCRAMIPPDDQRPTDAELTQRSEALKRRIEKKDRVIKKLIDGRITLFETATLFRRWNEQYPRLPDDPQDCEVSEEEQACNQVIVWARSRLSQFYPERADEFASRLKDELRRHKAEHGCVVLPDVIERDQGEGQSPRVSRPPS
jgi:hypothetical protein